MIHYLLGLLLAIGWWTVNGQRPAAAFSVDFYQLPMRPGPNGSVQLVLVCQGTGTLTGISVRLYCPVTDSITRRRSAKLSLCFENCLRTPACTADGRLCSPAECAQKTKGEAKFTYTFDPTAVAAGDATTGLSFECAYGWKRSALSIANSWQVTTRATTMVTTRATTKTTTQNTKKATNLGTGSIATGAGESTTNADASLTVAPPATAASEKNASVSHHGTATGLTMMDKLVIYIAGFCAVTVLAVAAVAVVTVYCVVCRMQRRRNDGRTGSRRNSGIVENGRDPEVFEKAEQGIDPAATNLLEMGPRPDLLPPDCDSVEDTI